MLLEKTGFTIEAEKGDWTDADATAGHEIIVCFARKSLNLMNYILMSSKLTLLFLIEIDD